jgi:hypothetical protein
LFRLFPLLKHHCQQPFIIFFHDAETPLFSMIDFFPMLKHHRSTLFHFLPILKHQSSAVLHLQQLFRSSLLLKHQSFTIVRQQAFTTSIIVRPSKQQILDTIKSRRHNTSPLNKHDIWLAERIKW